MSNKIFTILLLIFLSVIAILGVNAYKSAPYQEYTEITKSEDTTVEKSTEDTNADNTTTTTTIAIKNNTTTNTAGQTSSDINKTTAANSKPNVAMIAIQRVPITFKNNEYKKVISFTDAKNEIHASKTESLIHIYWTDKKHSRKGCYTLIVNKNTELTSDMICEKLYSYSFGYKNGTVKEKIISPVIENEYSYNVNI